MRVFDNRILRRISEPRRDENGEWIRLHNEEFYISHNIVRMINCRRFRWIGQLTRLEKASWAFKILTGKPK